MYAMGFILKKTNSWRMFISHHLDLSRETKVVFQGQVRWKKEEKIESKERIERRSRCKYQKETT